MFSRMKRPSAPLVISVAALVVALGGTSYAAAKIDTKDLASGAVTSGKIADGTIKNKDLAPQVRGVNGVDGIDGKDGADGTDGTGRWLLVDRSGAIVAQSGGFSIHTAYDLVNNSGAAVPGGALGNVYIDANEDLSNNGITVSIALQNQYNQDANPVNNGRNAGPDANPEFSGEITGTVCGVTGIVACAPVDSNQRDYFVVSPRMSDGSVTVSGADVSGGEGPNTHKRFYVIITGDSSDLAPAAADIPALALAPNPAA